MNRSLVLRATVTGLAALTLALVAIPIVFAVPPANDDFDSAIVIGALPFNDAQDTREATVTDDDPAPFCGGRAATVWYAFTPAQNTRVDINTLGSSYPTSISVYSGARGALGLWTCGGAQVSFTAQAGITYYFMIGSLSGGYPGPGGGAGGDLVLSVSQVPPPANDDFDDAIQITGLPFSDFRDTTGATVADDDPPSSCGGREVTVWYAFTPGEAMRLEANTFGSSYLTAITVFTGAPGSLAEVACGNSFSSQTVAGFDAAAGQTYYLMVGSSGGGPGGSLSFRLEQIPPAPPNDDVNSAAPITNLPFSAALNTRGATAAPDDPAPSCTGPLNATVWFSFTPDETLRVEVDAAGSNYPVHLAAYTGSPGALAEAQCSFSLFPPISFIVQGGQTYYFMVGTQAFAGGDLNFNVRRIPPPANDDFDDAIQITGLPFSDSNRDTRAATTAADDPDCFGREATVWYRFTPDQDARVEISTAGSNYSTSLSAYTGERGSLTQVGCTTTAIPGPLPVLRLDVSAGVTYHIMVAAASFGFPAAGGSLSLSVEALTVPANDDFDNATAIGGLPFTDSLDTRGASTAPDDPFVPCGGRSQTVWYAFTPTERTRVEANTLGSNFGTTLAVFTGERSNLALLSCNQARFEARPGQTYYFMVGSGDVFGQSGGSLVFNVNVAPPGPPNDFFDDAAPVTFPTFSDSVNTREATVAEDDPAPSCGGREASVWYALTPAADTRVEINSFGSSYFVVLSLYTGSPGAFSEAACGFGPLNLNLVGGTTYFLMASTSVGGLGDNLMLNVQAVAPPANDNFADATQIAALPFTDSQDTRAATVEDDDPFPSCGGREFTVWYAFTPVETARVEFNTFGSNFTASLAAFTGSPGAFTEIACNVFGPVRFTAVGGTTYYLMVGGLGVGGSLMLNGQALAPPPNDDIASAEVIPASPFTTSADTRGATTDPADPVPSCTGENGREASVWYTFTPAGDQRVEVGVSSDYPASVTAFSGSPGALSEVACGFPFSGFSFSALGGQTYYLMVGGAPGGNLVLSVQGFPPPANDDFAGAIQIASLPFSDGRDTRGATASPDDPIPSCAPFPFPTVWYAFTPVETARVEFNSLGSSYATALAVFTGGPGVFSEVACTAATGNVRFTATGGTTHYLLVASYFSSGGDLVLNGQSFAPPANDDIADAETIPALPFSVFADTRGATTDPADPIPSCTGENGREASAWYRFTPTEDVRVDVSPSGDYPAALAVFTRSHGTLTEAACGAPFSGLSFVARAGRTYFLMLGGAPGGNVTLFLQSGLRAPNDDFRNATVISALPFGEVVDLTGVSRQAGEPAPSCAAPAGSVWYAFTPTRTQSLTASAGFPPFPTTVAVYTGRSLNRLSEVACATTVSGGGTTFRAHKGKTYYIQVGAAVVFGSGGTVVFTLEVAPAPVAGFTFSPGDPSRFDAIQFTDTSFDPAGLGIESRTWSFGDGKTSHGCCPTHRYLADGDYRVRLTVRTPDGRRSSMSQVVQVRTHDIAITHLTAPQSARAGQTRPFTFQVRNTRYPETAEFQLLRLIPGTPDAFEVVGTLAAPVPVRPGHRTTTFTLNYTFTADDALAGRVTFKVVAILIGARDARPGDNAAIAPPVRVRP
jgi:hypothetical protein